MLQMIKRQIDPEWIIKAEDRAMDILEAVKGTSLKSRFNTNALENHAVGELGEIIFAHWLTEKGIEYDWQNDKVGESDDYDFMISRQKIDVKTNMRHLPVEQIDERTFKLMLLDDQIGNGHADFYFWILIQGQNVKTARAAYLVGLLRSAYTKRYEIVEKVPGVRARWIPIGDVIAPGELHLVLL